MCRKRFPVISFEKLRKAVTAHQTLDIPASNDNRIGRNQKDKKLPAKRVHVGQNFY